MAYGQKSPENRPKSSKNVRKPSHCSKSEGHAKPSWRRIIATRHHSGRSSGQSYGKTTSWRRILTSNGHCVTEKEESWEKTTSWRRIIATNGAGTRHRERNDAAGLRRTQMFTLNGLDLAKPLQNPSQPPSPHTIAHTQRPRPRQNLAKPKPTAFTAHKHSHRTAHATSAPPRISPTDFPNRLLTPPHTSPPPPRMNTM